MNVALELGWGSGDYEVGYINEDYRYAVENGIEGTIVGPNSFCVDGEESIYVKDNMNYRILKYGRDGSYLGDILMSDIPCAYPIMVAGPDCCYFYSDEGNVIYRYRFQDKEMKKADLSVLGIDWDIKYLYSIYDDNGNAYFSDRTIPSGPYRKYYKVDSSFSSIVEARDVPKELPLVDYVDNNGDFFIARLKGNLEERALYKIDNLGNVVTVRAFSENLRGDMSEDIVTPEDLSFYHAGYYLSKDYEVVQSITTMNVSTSLDRYAITRNANVYFMQGRSYRVDDKSPFRVYRVDVNWDQTLQ